MQLAIFGLIYRFRIFNLGYQWWVWLMLFFCDEFSYYWFHRASHECRLFWASHVVHHSSQRYNLSTALRQSWTGTFMGWVFWMWLPLVGFRPMMILTMQAISLLYQFWIHTELVRSLGPLEWVMNTTNAGCSGHRTSCIIPRSATTSRPLCARAGPGHSWAGFSGCGCLWSASGR
jgi:sterol desaturase/sphingolipid hydroxylase (fatty acid hydroxylase superfamily)